jgi:asparagine synthase (glutamine-hydrolysing)
MERPVGDALVLAYWQLARETSRDFKVVLSGEGADESYGGYSFHKIISDRRRRRPGGALACRRHRGYAPGRMLDKFRHPAFSASVQG